MTTVDQQLSGRSLRHVFHEAEKLCLDLENSSLSSSDPAFLAQLERALSHMSTAFSLCSSAQLFSKNEEFDDIATSSLKYLLIRYYLGFLKGFLSGPTRLQTLRESVDEYSNFLKQIEHIELLHPEEKETIKQLQIIGGARSTSTALSTTTNNTTLDPNTRRSYILNRAKRDMQAKQILNALIKKREERQKNNSKSNKITSSTYDSNNKLTPNEKAQNYEAEGEEEEDGEEEWEREYYKLTIQNAARKAIKEIELSLQEIELLLHASPQLSSTTTSTSQLPPSNYKDVFISPSGGMIPMNTITGVTPLSAVTQNHENMMFKREQLEAGVFRPSYAEATLTPDQWYQQQIKAGKIKIQSDPIPPPPAEEEDSDRSDDEEVYRARAMDDWKDTHPAGSGNMKGRA